VLNEIELTILTLAAEGPRYSSEFEQMIDERGLREWLTVGSSSAAYVLSKLESQHLIASHVDASGNRIHQLTDAGRGVLQTAVANLLAQPRSLGVGVELALANLRALKPAQVYQAMKQRQVALRQQYQTAESLWNTRQRGANAEDEAAFMYSHGVMLMRAELKWLDAFLQDWRSRYPGVVQDGESAHSTRISRSTAPLNLVKKVQRLPRLSREE
jgi:DNA-binding PadR family transcriptional regulator